MSIQFTVPTMTCGHCVSTITKAIQQVAPDASVTTDLATHRVTVDGVDDRELLRQAIKDAGYEAQVA